MKYLERLKSEIRPPDQLQKVQKATDTPSVPTAKSAKRPFYSFYSTDSGHFPENDQATQEMQRGSTEWQMLCDDCERVNHGGFCRLKRTERYDPFEACHWWQVKNRRNLQ